MKHLTYKAEVENQLNKKIKRVGSNRGGEYTLFNGFCAKEGIIHDVTPWNITIYKSMFNCIYHVIWLYGWLELVMYEFLDVDAKLCGVLLN